MAAVVWFSPIGNSTQYLSLAQILALANGGTINTYQAGTSTPQATYTTSAGTTTNSTSIAIGANGTPATMIWLDVTLSYKFIILDAASNQIGPTFDNISPQTLSTLQFTQTGSGAVTRTAVSKLKDWVSVTDFGADPTGASDSTTAIVNATLSNTLVYFPDGTYKVTNLTISSVNNWGWLGAGIGGVKITTATTGTMVTISNCDFCTIDGIQFAPTGSLAASSGLLLNLATGNTIVRNCVFINWTGAGAKCVGTVGTPLSGNKFYDCYFLQNAAGAASTGQLDCTYNNDFMIANNQMGGQLVGPFSTYGVQFTNCNNGGFYDNYIWENNQGANFATCAYFRCFSNRFEQSQHEGVIVNSGTAVLMQDNWFNSNGLATLNTYNQLRLQGSTDCSIEGNTFYDFSGTSNAKYSCSIESNCTNLVIRGNVCDKYSTGAWNFDSSESFTQITTDGSVNLSSGTTVGAGATAYIALSNNMSAAGIASQFISARHTLVQIFVTAGTFPGVGQTFTYNLYKNASLVASTQIQLSGGSQTNGGLNLTTTIEDSPNNASYTVQVATSGGANVTAHWATIVYCER